MGEVGGVVVHGYDVPFFAEEGVVCSGEEEVSSYVFLGRSSLGNSRRAWVGIGEYGEDGDEQCYC